MVEAKLCIYCCKTKPLAEFSEEHVIPQFMGGSSECFAAVTNDVCQRCNSLFGRFVDASVAKGYFLNAVERNTWEACFDYDEKAGNVFPLVYLGKCQELELGDREEVEVWLCPDGGTAWHFHKDHGDDFDTFAGGDPLQRRKDRSSRIYVFFASQHLYWFFSNLKSVKAHFKEEPIFLGTDTDLEGQLSEERSKGQFCKKDSSAFEERNDIRVLLDKRQPVNHALKMDMLFDVRFLAKIAIAFGHKIFGDRFGTLRYTASLRDILWTRSSKLGASQNRVKMKSYFNGLQDYSLKSMSFPFGFVFTFKVIDKDLVLVIVFPSGRFVQVSITDSSVDPNFNIGNLWAGEHVLIAIPQLKKTLGPVSLHEFVVWKFGSHRILEFDNLTARLTLRTKMPPLRS